VVFDRLDLAVVTHLPAEAEERILDRPADLGDRVEVAEREVLAGEGDVDDLLAEAPVKLLALERSLALGHALLEARAHAVQEHAGLAVAHLAERKRERGLTTQEANPDLLELVARRRPLRCLQGFLLVLRPLRHGASKIAGCLPTTGSRGSTIPGRS